MTRRSVILLLQNAGFKVPKDVATSRVRGIWKLLWTDYDYQDHKDLIYQAVVQKGAIIIVCERDLTGVAAWRIVR